MSWGGGMLLSNLPHYSTLSGKTSVMTGRLTPGLDVTLKLSKIQVGLTWPSPPLDWPRMMRDSG